MGGGWRIGIDNQVVFFSNPGQFTGVVVEAEVNAFHVGEVGRDVVVGNRNPTLLHITWIGKNDVFEVNQAEAAEQYRCDDAVKVWSRDKTIGLVFGHFLVPRSSLSGQVARRFPTALTPRCPAYFDSVAYVST